MLYGVTCREVVVTAQTDGATITAAAATSTTPAAALFTIPANAWYIGKILTIRATGQIGSVITTPGTATFQVNMGVTTVFNGGAILLDSVATHINSGWALDIMLTCRAIGPSANLMGAGIWTCEDILGVPATAPKGVLTAMLPWNSAPTVGSNFDSTAPQQLILYFTQSVATGSFILKEFAASFEN